ncbi:MAG: cell division/cell wall cluster transcriptional repressor MraZ [Deltaproteobacteria bacterium]|jgi:MraZ protein|nr:cell division/cell wall cluster transcriptional repressor MraZ [Deltaproteobacteria bacterium]
MTELRTRSEPVVLSGEFFHSLDDKGRITLPVPLRQSLMSLGETDSLHLGHMPGTSFLSLYPSAKWNETVKAWSDESRFGSTLEFMNARRLFFSKVERVYMDKSGRILISPVQRERLGLAKDVVILGVMDKIEIWEAEAWRKAEIEAIGEREKSLAKEADRDSPPSNRLPSW